ncbi:hypothetical protein AXF42_Ash000610 [Apostasia shenzhenica]|uniref:Uncharacterized protein n=1 Tax=Apostasia shenzhenica TaxID=1088818 RepID=A0A2I0AGY3_9ASPA|nr:hypothetical protein AXF42_Ash000610 [Apostasia shenzhenica]
MATADRNHLLPLLLIILTCAALTATSTAVEPGNWEPVTNPSLERAFIESAVKLYNSQRFAAFRSMQPVPFVDFNPIDSETILSLLLSPNWQILFSLAKREAAAITLFHVRFTARAFMSHMNHRVGTVEAPVMVDMFFRSTQRTTDGGDVIHAIMLTMVNPFLVLR